MPSQRAEIPLGMMQQKTRSPFVSSQSLVNCLYEQMQPAGGAVYGGFGLDEFAECGDGPNRGVTQFNETVFSVNGDTLYSVDENGTETAIGAVAGYDPVDFSDNGSQLTIVSDSTSYVYSASAGLVPINDPDFQRASSTGFLKQTTIFTVADTSRFITSALNDSTDINALDVATAEAKPDKLVRVFVSGNEALMFGKRSVEGYYFSGKPDGVPLSPTQTYLDIGLAGRDAVCSIDNTVAWMSNLLDFRTLRDQTPLAIADPAIIALIQSWTNPGTARVFSIAVGGHEWMVVRHAQGCILWDATTRMWSMRQSFGQESWRAVSSVWAYDKCIMGDASNGKLWRLNPNTHAEGSDPLVRSIVSHTIGPGGSPFTLDKVEIEMETGVGLATGQGSDPKVYMQLSRDGGQTWGARMERSAGLMGKRNTQVVWQGPFGDFPKEGGVIKFGVSDPVRFVAKKCFAEFTVNRP
jgi:hypothetical protein